MKITHCKRKEDNWRQTGLVDMTGTLEMATCKNAERLLQMLLGSKIPGLLIWTPRVCNMCKKEAYINLAIAKSFVHQDSCWSCDIQVGTVRQTASVLKLAFDAQRST